MLNPFYCRFGEVENEDILRDLNGNLYSYLKTIEPSPTLLPKFANPQFQYSISKLMRGQNRSKKFKLKIPKLIFLIIPLHIPKNFPLTYMIFNYNPKIQEKSESTCNRNQKIKTDKNDIPFKFSPKNRREKPFSQIRLRFSTEPTTKEKKVGKTLGNGNKETHTEKNSLCFKTSLRINFNHKFSFLLIWIFFRNGWNFYCLSAFW
jgi:hypothetical protein